jgi:hypothetical protein
MKSVEQLELELENLAIRYTEATCITQEMHFAYNRLVSLIKLKKEMDAAGVTDETLIFNLGEFIGGEVYGTVNADKGYSFDKITLDYIEIIKDCKRFVVSAGDGKVVIRQKEMNNQ